MSAKKNTENEDRIWKRSTTPQAKITSSESLSYFAEPRSDTPSSRTFAADRYHARSTVFDATVEQSSIEQGLLTPTQIRTDLSRSPTKLRETRTFSSTVFLPPDPIISAVSPYKPKDHSANDFFGSEKPDFYSKKITIPGYQPNFQPKYKEINPTSTKNQDMYGKAAEFCTPKSELEVMAPSNLTAKDVYNRRPSAEKEMSSTLRKSLDAVSQVFPKSESTQNVRFKLDENEDSTPISKISTQRLRKSVENFKDTKEDPQRFRRSVDILKEDSQNSQSRVRLIKKPREVETSNTQNKIGQFNRFKNTKENIESPREQIRLIAKPRAQTPTQRSFPILNISAKELKQRELNISDIPHVKDESRTEDFELSGLSNTCDERNIRDLCKGVHIVNVNPQINNITGECTGSAILSLRYQPQYKSIENLKLTCIEKGLSLSASKKDVGKKNNYAEISTRKFLDNFLKADEKKIVDKYATPKTSRPDLVSSDDFYGSSPGVGRISYNTPSKPDRLRVSLDSWTKVKNSTPSKSPMRSVCKSNANFMRSTISSCNKVNKQI